MGINIPLFYVLQFKSHINTTFVSEKHTNVSEHITVCFSLCERQVASSIVCLFFSIPFSLIELFSYSLPHEFNHSGLL